MSSARAIATLLRSCRSMARSRRSRRLLAALAACATSAMMSPTKGSTKRAPQKLSNLVEPWVVVVVRTVCMTRMSVHARQRACN